MEDQPRPKGSWLHSISIVVLTLVGITAVWNYIDGRSKSDGALYLIAAAIAWGALVVMTRNRG